MIDADKIDLSPMPEIAQHTCNLAKKIGERYCDLNDVALKGIGIDGYFVAMGLAYVFGKKYATTVDVEPVEISSHGGKISFDKKKMNDFKKELEESEYDRVILMVDKRRKSGTLERWLEEEYPKFEYAVLIDLSGKAAISATNEDFGWIRWGDRGKEVYENAFKVLGLKIDITIEDIYSYTFQEPEEPLFMEQFYYELDKVMVQAKRKPVDEIEEESFE